MQNQKKITIKNRNYRELLVSSEKDKLKQFLIIDCCKLVIDHKVEF